MKNAALVAWLARFHFELDVCGRLHPELGAPCYEALGHSTLGATPRDRAHRCVVPTVVGGNYRRAEWTNVEDHRWRLDQRRRGRHPAGGDQP